MVKITNTFILLSLSYLSFFAEAAPRRKCPAKSPTSTLEVAPSPTATPIEVPRPIETDVTEPVVETVIVEPIVVVPAPTGTPAPEEEEEPENPEEPMEEPKEPVEEPEEPVEEPEEPVPEPEEPEEEPEPTPTPTPTPVATPTPTPTPAKDPNVCSNPIVRKEWSSMTNTQKADYIRAVKCLAKLPPKAKSLKASMSRFDDFVAIHNKLTNEVHWVGHFLPWHRYYLHAYEKALREECDYKGAQPYWDWIRDAKSNLQMWEYDIFSNTTGFGGNGPYEALKPGTWDHGFGNDRSGGGCVQSGPFTYPDFVVAVNKGTDYMTPNPRCLKRDFCPKLFKHHMQQSAIDDLNSKTSFVDFARRAEAQPGFQQLNFHAVGHYAVGGVLGNMGDANNSPGDPVFWLHHANMDRLWYNWQVADKSGKRIFDFGGPKKSMDYNGQKVTLDHKLELGELGESVTVREVMHTENNRLCYVYE